MSEEKARNVGKIVREWGGSKYLPLTQFLKSIDCPMVDDSVFVSLEKIGEQLAIIITKNRLPEEKVENPTV